MKKKPKKHVKQLASEYAWRMFKTSWGTMERAFIAGYKAASTAQRHVEQGK